MKKKKNAKVNKHSSSERRQEPNQMQMLANHGSERALEEYAQAILFNQQFLNYVNIRSIYRR